MSEPTEPLVRTERGDDGVVVVRLQRPPMNALSQALLGQLRDAALALAADPSVKAVVLAGSERAFAAGADVKEFVLDRPGALAVSAGFQAATDALGAIPRPVIAAVSGFALGGGMELALACDLRIAADSARLGQPEILLGIIPGGGGTQRLARLVGPARAKEIIWSGRQIRADEALAVGLVDRVVPADELEAAALEWARSFASGAVVAMGLAKVAIDRGLDGPLASGITLEAQCFADSFVTEDAATGVAAFLEHGPGKAVFRGA